MTKENETGLLGIKKITLQKLCQYPDTYLGDDTYFEFGIRWIDGEIADEILAIATDGYFDGDDDVAFEGETYRMEFGGEVVEDHLTMWQDLKLKDRVISLRYYVEFDAYLAVEDLRVGGNWEWGSMGGRSEKRQPFDFVEKWCGPGKGPSKGRMT